MRRKIVSCGFVLPCDRDVSTASTLEPVVRDERVEVARGVREQADLQPALAQRLEHRQRVVVQLEVVRVRPRALHLDRRGVGVAAAAHPLDDPLR